MADWNTQLREARRNLGLTHEELAKRAGMSAASLRAYELGRRHPTREHLSSLLRALRFDLRSRNAALISGGFAPESVEAPAGALSRREAARLIRARPWPSFVINELMETVAGNRPGLLLTGLTRKRMADRVERNSLVIASRAFSAPSADQLRDWGAVASLAIARAKASGIGSLEAPDAYFAAVLERVARGDPKLIRELTLLWDATPPLMAQTPAWSYAGDWTVNDSETIRFHCLAVRVNPQDLIEIHDWIPADAASHHLLQRHLATLRRRHR